MSASNVDSRPAVLGPYSSASADATVATAQAPTSSTRILDSKDASESVPKWQLFHDELLTPPNVSAKSGKTVDSAYSVLAGLKADDGRKDLYSIMVLLLDTSRTQRIAGREIRQAGYEAQISIQYDAAQKIRDSADERMWGGIIAGVGQVLGGALTAAGGAAAIGSSVRAGGQAAASGKALEANNQVLANSLTNSAQMWQGASQGFSAVGSGLGDISKSSGGLGQAVFDSKAAEFDAQKAEIDATGRKQEQMTQEVNEHMQQLFDVIRDVLDKLRSTEQSRSETNRGIARSL